VDGAVGCWCSICTAVGPAAPIEATGATVMPTVAGSSAPYVRLVGVAMDRVDKVDYWGAVGARLQRTNGGVWAAEWARIICDFTVAL